MRCCSLLPRSRKDSRCATRARSITTRCNGGATLKDIISGGNAAGKLADGLLLQQVIKGEHTRKRG